MKQLHHVLDIANYINEAGYYHVSYSVYPHVESLYIQIYRSDTDYKETKNQKPIYYKHGYYAGTLAKLHPVSKMMDEIIEGFVL